MRSKKERGKNGDRPKMLAAQTSYAKIQGYPRGVTRSD